MTSIRYPRCILATAVVPWTEDWRLDERLFRREIQQLLAAGYRHLYIFGTAGEGYAVSDEQFRQITRVFVAEMPAGGAEPMVGVISLSLATIVERIAFARELGVRQFQISLPSWGALDPAETLRFFDAVLGRFPDCSFLHYNLLRARRLVSAEEYARIADSHPNLVATKNTADSLGRIRNLLEKAPLLRHFVGEVGFADGSQIGEPGLLISVASTNTKLAQEYFAAGVAGDAEKLIRWQGELQASAAALVRLSSDGERIDGAYDKVLWKLHDPEFPLRLLPPYSAALPDAAEKYAAYLGENFPAWAPTERLLE